MNATSQKVFHDAMSLSYSLRARLEKQLLESLDDQTTDEDINEQSHLDIARKRLDEVKSGSVKTVSGLEATRRIRRILEE